jgi:hypothetical protein
MKKRISNVSPWQAGKTMSLVYFGIGVLIALLFGLVLSFVPATPGQVKPGIGFLIVLPIGYAILGLIFVPLCCWIYNIVAGLVGGIEFTVRDQSDA